MENPISIVLSNSIVWKCCPWYGNIQEILSKIFWKNNFHAVDEVQFFQFFSPFVLFLFYKLLDRIQLFDGGPASQQNKAKKMENLSDHQLLLKTQTVPEGKNCLKYYILAPSPCCRVPCTF